MVGELERAPWRSSGRAGGAQLTLQLQAERSALVREQAAGTLALQGTLALGPRVWPTRSFMGNASQVSTLPELLATAAEEELQDLGCYTQRRPGANL